MRLHPVRLHPWGYTPVWVWKEDMVTRTWCEDGRESGSGVHRGRNAVRTPGRRAARGTMKEH